MDEEDTEDAPKRDLSDVKDGVSWWEGWRKGGRIGHAKDIRVADTELKQAELASIQTDTATKIAREAQKTVEDEARMAREQREAAHETLLLKESAEQLDIETRKKLTRRASRRGVDLGTYLQEELRRRLKEIDLDARWKEIVQDLDAGDLIELSEQQLINKMTVYLVDLRREHHKIEEGDDPPGVKEAILKRYDKNIQSLEERIDARQNRLVLPEDGKEVKRLTRGTRDGGSEYPAEIDPDDY